MCCETQYNIFHFKFAPSIIFRAQMFFFFLKQCISHAPAQLFVLVSPFCETPLRMTNPRPQTEAWCHHCFVENLIDSFLSFFHFLYLFFTIRFFLLIIFLGLSYCSWVLFSSFIFPFSHHSLSHPPTSLFSPTFSQLIISASSFSAATLGGGTGCVEGNAGQQSNHKFSIGWSFSWFSSTLWPLPLNITSSLSG